MDCEEFRQSEKKLLNFKDNFSEFNKPLWKPFSVYNS